MERHLASPAQVDPPGRVKERRELGESVALPPGRDPGELAANLLRERHRLRIYNPSMSGPGLFRPPPPTNEPVRDYAPGLARAGGAQAAARRDAQRAARHPVDHRRRGGPDRRHLRSGRAAQQGPACWPTSTRAARRRSSGRSVLPARPGRTGTVGHGRNAQPSSSAPPSYSPALADDADRRDDAQPVEDGLPGRDRRRVSS